MKRHLLSVFAFVACALGALAQGFPTVSTAEKTAWYLIQFVNGGNAITAETSGAEVTTSAAVGSDAQLWKVTGNSTDGYQLTNKKGYTLYVGSAAKNQKVHAAASASGVNKFVLTANGSNYEIQPKGNSSISMNLWGGPSQNSGVGLWDKGDQNNPVTFVDASAYETLGKISLIPYPQELTEGDGSLFVAALSAITYNSEEMKGHIEDFAKQLKTSSGITLNVKKAGATASAGEIWFGTDETLPRDGYTLVVKQSGVEIRTSSFGGELYALQTLMQLLPREFFASELCTNNCSATWSLPVVSVKDNPQYAHRGFMMDVARHFFDKDEVKKVLDIMAFYKLNRFHWHLTDDQGWRIEIPEYPKLTEVGAVRAGSFTNNGDGTKFFDDTEYGRGMWFSQADLREIVAYAAERNIDILPEIDLPGHMVAAVASYPELSCDPTKKYEVRIDGGISHDVLNVGKDEVIDFLKCVLGHVAEIFPFPYIHLGGDECPTEQWATNEDCLRRVQEEGLSGVNELQSWLVEKLGTFLKEEYGKDIVVWDEVLAHWDNNNTVRPIVMAWNNSGAPSGTAANYGLQSIMCPYSHVYIDFPQVPESQMLVDEPYYGGWGTNTIERVYSLNPVAYLSGKEEFCWGAQANLWAETLNDNEELEYQLLPRILALAEVGWLPIEKKNWISFYKRLQSHDEILDQLGYAYGKHYIEPKEYTAAEQAIMEAESILAGSIRGGVGYPAASLYDDLQAVLESTKASSLNADALQTAIAAYKAAPLVQPEAGKTYRILSASTYYKRQYEGSSMYQKGSGVNFHYTPQTEPEELWQFVPSGNGYILTNCYSGGQLTMETYNAAVTITQQGTPIRVDKATIATQNYDYIPGVVTLSAVSGYSATVTGSVKRLSAELSGQVHAKDEAALCYNGTWRIEEVTDYTAWLEGLVDKCELILRNARPGETNQPTEEALGYLRTDVLAFAEATLAEGAVSEEEYEACVAKYLLFQQMERTGFAQSLDEGYYYHLRNVWFNKYASYNSSSKTVVHQSSKGNSDNYLWRVVKQPDGTIYLINKATGTAAYPASEAEEGTIKLGKDYAWTLEERTNDGKTGICIINSTGAYSWYINPDVWTNVIFKPITWGASTWEFQKSAIVVEVAPEEDPTVPVTPQAGIFPQPQQVKWGSEKAFDNTVAYNLVGAATADADAVALLQKNFSTTSGTISLTIGERGDAAVAAYESLIPSKAEGYYLSVSKDGVVIAGNDASGTYYGVQTYLQVAAQPEVKAVTITDWPVVGDRGLVEGYYGNPYSDADRKSLLEFFGRAKMNVYIYGPKDDPYHRDRWREEYPADKAQMISGLAAAAAQHKVRFVWAMHPGLDIQWNEADKAASLAKLEKMYALGVRAFAIFFDDIEGAEQRKGDKQAAYLNYLNDNFVKKHSDVAPIIMCPTHYCKSYTGGDDTYLRALGGTLAAETHVMWTGAGVVDMINKSDMEWVNSRISRKAYIWLNYPVTDYCRDHILMGPTFGNDLDIASQLGGFVSNPMEYAEASKVSLYSIGDYCWNMEAYDADASWESAIQYLMPQYSAEFRLFCENNVDLGDNVHGLRRENESPSFVEARDAFNALMTQGNTTAAVAKLREHFNLMADAATKLMASSYNPALTVEITPWCEVMNYIALKGLELMKMYEALETAQPEAFVESYLLYLEYDEAQSAVRSRDFEGSIRVARPAVGSRYIIPFLKNTLDELVVEYKSRFDYRLDVFPGQEIDNGDYFIMYDGKYLTNQSEGVAATAPAFVEKRDDVKPQRQEWNISMDAATGRYKIVNRQDDRYLNEKGEFTVNNSTNPYEAAWHTYNIMRLANGKYCIQNGGSAGDKIWTVSSSRITKSNSNVLEPAYFIFDLVPVNGEADEAPIVSTRDVYYIMDGGRYLTNTNVGGSGGTPTFKSVATPGEAQEWNFTIDASGKNFYKITSAADGRYINEKGVFGTNAYYSDWNTYLILTMDGMCAIQTSQSAGVHLWNIKNDRLEQDGSIARQDAYVIKIVAKGEVTGPDPDPVPLKQYTVNGVIDGPDNTALPSKVMPGLPFDVVLRGAPGYAAKGLTVRYGINPNGDEFDAEGNRQWTEAYVAAVNGAATIPAELTEGGVNLYATFEREEGSEWCLVFSDEFNAADYSQPVNDKWMRCQRYGATWNRWLSDSEEVIYLEDGDLVARAIPNPDKANDPVDMITGGIKSMGRFGFTYGYVEARIYNNLWRGNFPAFWMMPEDQSAGWPDCGEIDIWEVIDTENRSYHTIHSNWTYDLGYKNNPQSSFNTSCSYDRYHTYGLAWDATTLIWYLDGKEVGRYAKSTNQSHLDQGQWPFDKHFHLILNQSVGNGSWAANADITHTYETRFDWVRVYQKEGMLNTDGIVDAIDVVMHDAPANDAIYTLQGVRVNGPVESLPKGLYIVGGKKIVIK